MYENEIKDLLEIRRYQTSGYESTIDTATALMRAAEPKDEAAEREYCMQLAQGDYVLRDSFMQQRAAVRAELSALVEGLREGQRDLNKALNDAEQELAALKAAGAAQDEAAERAECMRLAVDLDDECSDAQLRYLARKIGDIRAAVRAEMAAEIEQLRGLMRRAFGLECCDTDACVEEHVRRTGAEIERLRAEVRELRNELGQEETK